MSLAQPVPHLSLAGAWELCAQPGTCELAYHAPVGMSLAEVELAPQTFLEVLLHSNPDEVDPDWLIGWKSPAGRWHRDYDLPALIYVDAERRWMQHGKLHREHGPAVIDCDGRAEWWQHGEFVRAEEGYAGV